jgi:hypothetical protein
MMSWFLEMLGRASRLTDGVRAIKTTVDSREIIY